MKRKLLYLSAVLLGLLPLLRVTAQSVPPNAGFAYDTGIDTIWINSPYRFVNTSSGDTKDYWDITPITGVMPVTTPAKTYFSYPLSGGGLFLEGHSNHSNFDFKFTDTGTYRVKMVVTNNIGADSVTKIVYVGFATRAPKANFYINKQVIGQSEAVPLFDLSSNGPTFWHWTFDPACYSCGNPNVLPNSFILSNEYSKSPTVLATEGGKYGICLVVSNAVGSDTLCKKKYIEVIAGFYVNKNPRDTFIDLSEAYLYDNGGPAVYPDPGAYYTSQASTRVLDGKFYTIAPCASKVILNIESFKLRNVDTIIFREISKTGTIIARLGGSNLSLAQRTVTANSGRMVLEWKCGPGDPGPTDSGFVFKYTSIPATYGIPNASFTAPDIIYSGYTVQYVNQSTGQGNLSYAWDTDGSEGDADPNNNNGYESIDPLGASYTFNFLNLQYKNICLKVTNCKGTSTFCKMIEVRPIVTAPVADFTTPRAAGFTTDIYKLIDQSKNGALTWEWTITPNTVTYLPGYTKNSQNPMFKLNQKGNYNVKLKVTNPVGVDSIEKLLFLNVISYSSPNTAWPIASGNDIGISRFVFNDIDTSTAEKTPIYDTLFTRKTTVLYRGVNYPMQVFRKTAVTAMDRKIWIDTSLDGYFLAPGELIYSEINQKTLTANSSFILPNNIEPGRILRLRIGISEANSALTSDMATSGCFEDYGIEVGADATPPAIHLKGDTLLRVQLNQPFAGQDSGVLAIDNIEGDISSKYESITDLNTSVVGYYFKKYFVRDLYGNVSDTVYRTIQVEVNQTGPKLSLNASDSVFINVRKDTLYKKIAVPTAVNYLGATMNPALIVRTGTVDTATIGNYSLTWTIKDEFGFSSTKTQRFYVRDITAPTIAVFNDPNNLHIINHQIGTLYEDKDIVLNDNYYTLNQLTLTRTGSVNVNQENTYNIQYVVCDPSGNCSAPFFVQVNVKDVVKPTVTLLGENPWKVDVFTTKAQISNMDPSVSYFDNYYQQSALTFVRRDDQLDPNKLGSYPVTYMVRDGAGNETILTRIVQVVDREAPRIELFGGSTVDLIWNDTFNDPGVKIIDNYDSDAKLQSAVLTSTTLDVAANGKWYGGHRGWKEVHYNVKDSSGNAAREMIRRVYVDFRSGLSDVKKIAGELTVYPNPNSGTFTLSTKEALKGSTTATIYNILGSKVYSETFDASGSTTHEIKTTQLSSGVYLLNVTNNGKQYTQRITIK